jgi:hypothetical protein
MRGAMLSRARLPDAPPAGSPFEAPAAACASREAGRKIRAKALKALFSRKESEAQTATFGRFWQAFSRKRILLFKRRLFFPTNVRAFPRRSQSIPRDAG